MDPDRRTLFEAAFGALMIRTARPRPPGPPTPERPESSPNILQTPELGGGHDEAKRGIR
jgi:hypothetical protein